MTPNPTFSEVLQPGETPIWQGRIGFTFSSSSWTIFALFTLAAYAFWATWGTFTVTQFCPPGNSSSKCESMFLLAAPIATAIAISQVFDAIERRALSSGKAQGAIILTDRRLIRVLDWPWLRVRSYDYRATTPRRGIGGVIRFGVSSVIVTPQDAALVHELMQKPREIPK